MRLLPEDAPVSRRTLIETALGLLLIVAGAVIIAAGSTDSRFISGGAPIFTGVVVLLHGMAGLAGYKSFVAWRYLLNHDQKVTRQTRLLAAGGLVAIAVLQAASPFRYGIEPDNPIQILTGVASVYLLVIVTTGVLRHSKPALFMFIAGMVLTAVGVIGQRLLINHTISFGPDMQQLAELVMLIMYCTGGGIAFLALFFGCLRAFFTFFTTVPIGGVWIGTAALVCVLSVMSGFETDLRDKILGSNAHIQITREDGEFVDWRDAKAKIDRIPGVVASTPYAVSEVVVAAHQNGMPVIIKGIDPDTVGAVTDLVSDIRVDPRPDGRVDEAADRAERQDAMRKLRPLVEDTRDRRIPQPAAPTRGTVDPAPDDMPTGGEPIDFSGPTEPPDAGSGSGSGSAQPRRSPLPPRASDPPRPRARPSGTDPDYGGDAIPVLGERGSSAGAIIDPPPHLDVGYEAPMSNRTKALPGMLIGSELQKQTSLYVGAEVRVVSPLSDPSNPDATGTPIPFNRDYRVAGVFYTGMYEYDLKFVYVTLDSLQAFLDRGDAVDGIEVRIEDADDTGRYVPTEDAPGLIRETLGPGYRIVDWRELNRSLFSALKLEKIAMFLVLAIVILVASFSIVGNLIMVVIEKAKEIALLKTLGASDVGVLQTFAMQGLLIGLIGTILGVLTGLAGCWAGKRFGIPLNPNVYYIDRLPIHVDWQSVAQAAVAGVVISILATLYPALLAARVRPATGMRH